ncbi:uncharacterized protein LOC132219655 [Myotis daubentonii]|uniref:uncharacterized protein LOC132219655 n=1 Tax=Myotis daubentonii TaxID=98922 RepID=UPI002872C34F|nr:uncharacterized protein LOC132219655 [Myotis daubentonii]
MKQHPDSGLCHQHSTELSCRLAHLPASPNPPLPPPGAAGGPHRPHRPSTPLRTTPAWDAPPRGLDGPKPGPLGNGDTRRRETDQLLSPGGVCLYGFTVLNASERWMNEARYYHKPGMCQGSIQSERQLFATSTVRRKTILSNHTDGGHPRKCGHHSAGKHSHCEGPQRHPVEVLGRPPVLCHSCSGRAGTYNISLDRTQCEDSGARVSSCGRRLTQISTSGCGREALDTPATLPCHPGTKRVGWLHAAKVT